MITTLYEPFRHWSEGGSVYILSDMHFADSDCKLMDPNWITPEEQLDIINNMVGKSDTFVCLGDVGDPKYVPMIKGENETRQDSVSMLFCLREYAARLKNLIKPMSNYNVDGI